MIIQWFSQAEGDLRGPHVASEEEKWPHVPHGYSLSEAGGCRGPEGADSSSCEDSNPEEELQPGQHVAEEEEERSSDLSADENSELMID